MALCWSNRVEWVIYTPNSKRTLIRYFMDAITEINNHGYDVIKLTACHDNPSIKEIEDLNSMISEMKRRFAHTFFFPNRYAKDFSCKCWGHCAN